ncbi:unnamed protein product [Rotaria socialis]|uniref:ABC transmembrane type-1 domain-containing protein n=1 Tax=Rotaria socialis TaxID=392032 RepID=A0A818AXZ1_9BILA|nr:unnamed protein product [Rotaria socialis]
MAKEGGKYQALVKLHQIEKNDDEKDDMISMEKAREANQEAIAGSKLTERVRSQAFACLLRQEVADCDRPENSSGAISFRLASDASAIREIASS